MRKAEAVAGVREESSGFEARCNVVSAGRAMTGCIAAANNTTTAKIAKI